ncbi:IS200/IS605 family transposase [Belliella sp. DSM 107340]|uniref:IS200/IS605 family transposase n=1 Tax=Belliella calami TaxID=2923436 RepID=A0ABS9UPI7_9BACT|nr:IS200/IS605 family transposase [Belliella calami]MCH7398541.1 IS200/IS605 family transposase [Belliella calami]
MSTYTSLLYHIVFSTYKREKTITKNNKKELFAYIYGYLRNKNCHLYRLNGVEDHIHIFTHIHQSISLASLVKDIKLSTTALIKEKGLFENWKGWQEGYGAFTVNAHAKEKLIDYIINQEEHHKNISFLDEYKKLLNDHGVIFDEKYLL